MSLSINYTQLNNTVSCAIMVIVVTLNVVMLSVVGPSKGLSLKIIAILSFSLLYSFKQSFVQMFSVGIHKDFLRSY
jgi:hypothetical protein